MDIIGEAGMGLVFSTRFIVLCVYDAKSEGSVNRKKGYRDDYREL